jgi:hypothetical protein
MVIQNSGREARAFLLDAVPHTGSFLDVGAANGHLR